MRIRHPLFVTWVLLAAAQVMGMLLSPGEETVPYHLGWIGLAIAYDLEVWSTRRAAWSLAVFSVLTGGILVVRAADGTVAWQETAEIPLMGGLLLLVMWNIHRRRQAMGVMAKVAARERTRASLRERLSRLTSHEMRTPATIASGYTELLLAGEDDPARRSDLEVIRSELSRLVLASDRLVRVIRIPEQDQRTEVDLGGLVSETVDRWHVVADRAWVVDGEPLPLTCSPDRIRAALDTLIENALRYTEDGDTIRVVARRQGRDAVIGVADSGSGLSPHMVARLNGSEPPEPDRYLAADTKAQTGLGLSIVQEVAAVRGGHLVAGRSAEGGALVLMIVPITVPAVGGRVDTSAVPVA
ncbi:MAG: HAMP domain-containing sensor histidine kinase [Nocardioidaceae bacterium]